MINTLEAAEREAVTALVSPGNQIDNFEAFALLLKGYFVLGNNGLLSKSDHRILESITERTRRKLEKIERRRVLRERAIAAGDTVKAWHLTDANLLRQRDPQ